MLIVEVNREHTLNIRGELHVSGGDEVKTALIDFLLREPALKVDLSKVEACDAAGVQLLLSLRNSAREAKKPFSVVAQSDAVLEACALLGLPLGELSEADESRLEPAESAPQGEPHGN